MRTKTHPVMLICCTLLSAGCCRVATLPNTQESIKAETLVHYVNLAWASHACRLDKVGISLKNVKLTLQTKNEIVADGSIDLVVVSADNKEDVTSSETLVVTLSPPDVGKQTEARAKPTDFEKAINEAFDHVTTAATAIHDVELTDSALRPLPFAGIEVTVGFDVVLTQTGALSLQWGSIKLGPSLSHNVSGSQEMVFTFEARPAGEKMPGC